jgi:hypothetical protein
MQKIYTYARNMIYAITAELSIKHDFLEKETVCKAGLFDSPNDPVVFEIHQKIKELLETISDTPTAKEGTIDFEKKNDSIFKATVRAGGVESYFFARMLYTAMAKLRSGIVNTENLNCKLIETYAMQAIASKTNQGNPNNEMGLIIKANFRSDKQCYEVDIPFFGSSMTFSDTNTDRLCRLIGQQIRADC